MQANDGWDGRFSILDNSTRYFVEGAAVQNVSIVRAWSLDGVSNVSWEVRNAAGEVAVADWVTASGTL